MGYIHPPAQFGVIAQATVPKPTSPVQEKLQRLEQLTGELNGFINRLETKLGIILTPQGPDEPKAPLPQAGTELLTTLDNLIDGQEIRLRKFSSVIDRIIL